MSRKEEMLANLRLVLSSWEEGLSRLTDEEITTASPGDGWSVRDVVAHLWSWQQLTLARVEAGAYGHDPRWPDWPEWFDPNSEDDVDRINAWLHDESYGKAWPTVYEEWRAQFLRLLEVAEQIPEEDLSQAGRFEWMGEWPLMASLEGTYEHHTEHLEELSPPPRASH